VNPNWSTARGEAELLDVVGVVLEWVVVVVVVVVLLDVVLLVLLEWLVVEVLEEVCIDVLDELALLVEDELEAMDVAGSVIWIALGTLTATGDAPFPETKIRRPTWYVPGSRVTLPLKTPPPAEEVVT